MIDYDIPDKVLEGFKIINSLDEKYVKEIINEISNFSPFVDIESIDLKPLTKKLVNSNLDESDLKEVIKTVISLINLKEDSELALEKITNDLINYS